MLSKNDIKVLYCLYKEKCDSPIKSITISKIQENTGFKSGKVRYIIRSLLLANYIEEGYRAGSADTFFISQRGIDMLKGVSS